MTKLQGSKFVTSPPPHGMGLEFQLEGEIVHTQFTFPAQFEGPPTLTHGGILATVMDEAMGAAAWNSGHQVIAVHLGFGYKAPIPLGQPVTIRGWVERVDGRKVFTASEIRLADGTMACYGEGVFVIAPQFFDAPAFTPKAD